MLSTVPITFYSLGLYREHMRSSSPECLQNWASVQHPFFAKKAFYATYCRTFRVGFKLHVLLFWLHHIANIQSFCSKIFCWWNQLFACTSVILTKNATLVWCILCVSDVRKYIFLTPHIAVSVKVTSALQVWDVSFKILVYFKFTYF